MNPIAVTAVQAMVAPVVLITTAAILSGALLTMYGSVNDRMRAMDHERLEILTGAGGTLLSAAEVTYPRATSPITRYSLGVGAVAAGWAGWVQIVWFGVVAGRRGRGVLKLGRDERLDVLGRMLRRGGNALAGQERHQECPVVGVGADGPPGQVGRRLVKTPARQKYAKLSNAGGACCGLAEVLDSTLCHRYARPDCPAGSRKIPGQTSEDRPR